jgi:hypothetical protein
MPSPYRMIPEDGYLRIVLSSSITVPELSRWEEA